MTSHQLSRRDVLQLGGAALAVSLTPGCTQDPHARTTTMTQEAAENSMLNGAARIASPRAIVHRTRGRAGGPITRLVSPSDLGELMKPFVFLDLFDFDGRSQAPSLDHGWHPHSGIATVTVVLEGAVQYAETTGSAGVLPAGGIEWMRAGGGVWHTGTVGAERVRGFQLWVALPPELENAPNASQYVQPAEVPADGPVRVILGSYGHMVSPIAAPPMTYLVVSLKDGQRWTYQPPAGHDVAWVSLMDGALATSSRITQGEVAIFERSEASIDFVAEGETRFVLGSAARHPHPLVLGNYSVHTTLAALQQGETEIRRIGRLLHAEGKRSYALRSL